MAVDSMQVDSKPFALAFTGKSKSAEHVSIRTSLVEDGHAPSPSGSELTCHEEQQAIEKLRVARKTLEDEIEIFTSELRKIGEEMHCSVECIGIIQDSEEAVATKLARQGRKRFNNKPSEGIKFLLEKKLLNKTAEDIALFLFSNQLDKKAIGDYLGEGYEFNIQVLHQFVGLQNFCQMDLVTALRTFLASFQLPGEAQKIDRMMESFAFRYCQCNPGIFSNTDTCYILSFAIIMLNTTLHNANVKFKTSVDQFISMNRDIDAGKELPPELLTQYYEAIKAEPFHYHQGTTDDLTEVFFNPDYKGWLTKEGGKHKSWRKRWFILTDNCLYYFKTPVEKEPQGIIPLENLEIRDCPMPPGSKKYCFEIMNQRVKHGTIKACKTTGDGKLVVGNHLMYRIQAASAKEKEEWMKRIRASISRNPLLEILQKRMQKVTHDIPINM
ncbi:hypothetical protein EMCRGX_G028508 [Ephydatia muelleri]|eukprot:Em0020g147a